MTSIIETKPYEGQKPGTSGLRKKVVEFQRPNYLANFVQALFNALPESDYVGQTLLVSGDGRFWCKQACEIICSIASANGVKRVWIGQNGWVSTPAGSCIIRDREGGVCKGGILLTASHNPGGPTEDFGIKYNGENGAPAPESVTEKIYAETQTITKLKMALLQPIDFSAVGSKQKPAEAYPNFTVEIIDPVEDWLKLMKTVFDFELIKSLVKRPDFKFVYDGLNGIAGPYAKAIFVKEFGCDEKEVLRQCDPLEDFGKGHPDPNLTYAKRLVREMGLGSGEEEKDCEAKDCCKATDCKPCEKTCSKACATDKSCCKTSYPDFGAAGDGDNDRNMILGNQWFVTPSDSVAIIVHYAKDCIPYFKSGLKGCARSMPTSLALKLVAEKKGISHYEVPTGWKFFGNLMDANLCSICGEESFGTGSDHIREKDGLWAVLAWLSILAHRSGGSDSSKPIVSVKKINEEFWATYGRNWYVRYDFENVDTEKANKVMAVVADQATDSFDNAAYMAKLESGSSLKTYLDGNAITTIDTFNYTDPVDKSVSKNQGLRVFFKDGSRFVLRLSGTGSSGATIRLYLEKYSQNLEGSVPEVMSSFIQAALKFSRIKEILGTDVPTVIT